MEKTREKDKYYTFAQSKDDIHLCWHQKYNSVSRRNTGLPTKDETSETIVRNLYCLFPCEFTIACNCKLVAFFAKSSNTPLNKYIQGRRLNLTLESSYLMSFRSSLQSHPLWDSLTNSPRTLINKNMWVPILYLPSREKCMVRFRKTGIQYLDSALTWFV